MRQIKLIPAVLFLLAIGQMAYAVPILISSLTIQTEANDSSGSLASYSDSSTAFGFRTFSTPDGGSSSSLAINWVDTGTGALFDLDFAHVRTGTENSSAAYSSDLMFVVTEDIAYSISGQYNVFDVSDSNPGGVNGYAYLRNLNFLNRPEEFVMRDITQSRNTLNESLVLGVAEDGDHYNVTSGVLSGTLRRGYSYHFYVNNFIDAYPDADLGASATGCVTLSLGGATGAGTCGLPVQGHSVPEPSTLALLGIGLFGMGLARRRRKV